MRMDSFAKKYLAVLGAVMIIAAAWWLLSRDTRVAELNAMLAADTELAGYPYSFRVLSLENGVAEMSSPRSAEVPVMQFLRSAFPALANTPVDHPEMMAAQDELVRKQARAAKLVTGQPDVRAVRWTLDEDWYRQRGVLLNP
jgi:hypothetical protein